MVKYRLERMRGEFERNARQSATRESHKCGSCGAMYVDLDLAELFDGEGGFRCSRCGGEVDALDMTALDSDVASGVNK